MATLAEALATAIAHHRAGRLDLAEEIYRRVLAVEPDHADALHLSGMAAYERGEAVVAVEYIRRALAISPWNTDYYNNLAAVLQSLHRSDEAIACYRQGLALNPGFADLHYNLGNTWRELLNLPEAIECYRRAVQLDPQYAEAHNNQGVALHDLGEPELAVACYRRALQAKRDFAQARSNLLFALQYCGGVTLRDLAEAHSEYEEDHASPLRTAWRPHENTPDPDRRLRLGFVSPDFGEHPVGRFLVRALENVDRRQCDVVCYSDRLVPDALTDRLRAASSAWEEVLAVPDDQLADRVRKDRIDILFDLAGHTARNRLAVFARKPAPLQATWIGYVGTTGLRAMDYIVADHYEIPPAAEPYYCEKALRLPDGYVCFDPPADAPPVGLLPATERGTVAFVNYGNPAKITPTVVATWARILRRLPTSRLLLRYRGLGSEGVPARLRRLFAAHAIDFDRVELAAATPHAEYLDAYNRADLSLDTFPYSGGLTTCEALWMGVPVITCPGETFASRHSLTHLANVGLRETIAGNLDEYVEIAVSLAQDLPRLAALRAALRDRVARSPLCDGPRFARNLMALLRDVWREWCEEQIANARYRHGGGDPLQ